MSAYKVCGICAECDRYPFERLEPSPYHPERTMHVIGQCPWDEPDEMGNCRMEVWKSRRCEYPDKFKLKGDAS